MPGMPVRKPHIEILRIIAIYLVVASHTPACGMPFQSAEASVGTFAMICATAFAKIAVPLFFMISGALLIPKKESIAQLFKKRISRMAIIIILFVAIQYAFYYFTAPAGAPPLGWTSFIRDVYHGDVEHSYVIQAWAVWFPYAYMGLLLSLPFLRLIADRMESHHFLYLVFLPCTLGFVIPFAYCMLTGDNPSSNGITSRMRFLIGTGSFLVFALYGYYLENKVDIKQLSWKYCFIFLALAGASLALEGLAVICMSHRLHSPHFDIELVTLQTLNAIPCCALYVFLKKLCAMWESHPRLVKYLGYIGAATFTVYLTEHVLRCELSCLFDDLYTRYLSSCSFALLVTVCGICIGLILKRIPIIKKII